MQFRIAYLKVSQNDEIVTPYLIIVNELIVRLNYKYQSNNIMRYKNPALFGDIEIQFAVKIPHNNYRAMLYPLKTFRMN